MTVKETRKTIKVASEIWASVLATPEDHTRVRLSKAQALSLFQGLADDCETTCQCVGTSEGWQAGTLIIN